MKSASTYKSLILILFALLFSCTNTNDDIGDIDFEDFLQKNDGTEWLLANDELKVFIRLNNDQEHLIEQWKFQEEQECYEYNANIFSPGTSRIIENETSELMIEGDPVLSDYQHMTLSRKENTLKVVITVNEWQSETVYFNLSTLQVEDLEACDRPSENKFNWN